MARAAWVWTPERKQAVEASAVGRTYAQIAVLHPPLSAKAVERAIVSGIVSRPPVYNRRDAANDTPPVPRDCLCCGKAFKAATRFIRRCDPCLAKSSAAADWSLSTV